MLMKTSVNSNLALVCLAIFPTFVVFSVQASGLWPFGHNKNDQLKSSSSSSASALAAKGAAGANTKASSQGGPIYLHTGASKKETKPYEQFQIIAGLFDPLLREKGKKIKKIKQVAEQQHVDSDSAAAIAYSRSGDTMSGSAEGSGSPPGIKVEQTDGGSSRMDKTKLVFELYSDKGKYRCSIQGIPDVTKLKKFCPGFNCTNRDIAVISHGMTDKHFTPVGIMEEREHLGGGFDSAIFLNWTVYSDIGSYLSALHNRNNLGEVVGDFVLLLRKTKQLTINRVHLMGYSMGAHIVAFAARRIKETLDSELPNESRRLHKVGALTAFDAASPLISHKMFLNKEDALVVQGIHTSYHFGVTRAFGHLDYFPNGGFRQPGCPHKKLLPFDPLKVAASEGEFPALQFEPGISR